MPSDEKEDIHVAELLIKKNAKSNNYFIKEKNIELDHFKKFFHYCLGYIKKIDKFFSLESLILKQIIYTPIIQHQIRIFIYLQVLSIKLIQSKTKI
ncbi:hypothetical protein RFI_25911 [Reticulomyxa filosa]|uniref:Uncharacterized protein n=1 Tax=Reticulomyxa filosa TaxID=46433 RepID=X6MCU4_RETFI|nr:hypothetical protein RFI_25911 [Reticulomyxa filosa]|eukprot:ETO11466.1 hypothetical protein RFI_25911 [Reticulomyxa filosa]